MVKAEVFTKTGAKSTQTTALPGEIFDIEVKNHQLLHEALRAYQANRRQVSAKTKSRGEVRGGGKKPWRQKGTGRARAGSLRSPIWRGGGVIFGPTGNENYRVILPTKAKRLAIKQALSLKAADGAVKLVEELPVAEGKTKELAQFIDKLKIDRYILLVVDKKTAPLSRAANNLANLKLASAQYLNVFDVLRSDHILMTKPALRVVQDWLAAAKTNEISTKSIKDTK